MAISGTRAADGAVTFKDAIVSIDQTPASSSFIAVSTWGTNITVSGGDTPVNTMKTYAGAPIVLPGEINNYRVELELVYTETATDPFKEIYDDYAASPGLAYDLRWVPSGGGSGSMQFTTSGGRLVQCSIPTESAEAGGPAIFTITIECSSITLGTSS